MSLHDEIRDELYGPQGSGDAEEAALSAVDEVLESASYPHSAFKVLAIAAVAEAGFLAMSLLGGDAAWDALYDSCVLAATGADAPQHPSAFPSSGKLPPSLLPCEWLFFVREFVIPTELTSRAAGQTLGHPGPIQVA